MALAIAPRLSAVRRAVAVRCKMGAQAERSPAFRDEMDEWIREAFHEIINEADFLVLKMRAEIDLIHGQHSYDVPDNLNAGDIDNVYVRQKVVSDTGGTQTTQEYVLKPGLRAYERSAWKMPEPDPETGEQEDRTSLPLRYEIVDQNFDIYPAPNTDIYSTLVIEGYRTPPEPTHNDDRLEVDKEAIIRLATAIGKAARRQSDAADTRARYEMYVEKYRANQSEGDTFRVGGRFSRKFPCQQQRSTTGPDYSRYPFWNPPDGPY